MRNKGKPPAISRRPSAAKANLQLILMSGRDENGMRLGVAPPAWQIVLLGAVEGLKRALAILRERDKGGETTPEHIRQRWIDTLQAIGVGLLNTGEFNEQDVTDIIALRAALIDLDRGRIQNALRPSEGAAKVGSQALRLRGFAAAAVWLRSSSANETLESARKHVVKELNRRDAADKLEVRGLSEGALKKWWEHAKAGDVLADPDAHALGLVKEWATDTPTLSAERVLNTLFGPPINHTPPTARPLTQRE